MRQVRSVEVPKSGNAKLNVQGREVALTNLDKPFWPELKITKGDLIQVLRRRRAGPAAAHRGPGDGDEALPPRSPRRILFHEARTHAAPLVDPHLPYRSRLRERHRLPGHRRRAVAALGDQSRVYRLEPVVRQVRRRSTGPTTCTSISIQAQAPSGRRCSSAAESCATPSTPWRCRPWSRPPAPGDCTSTCQSCADRCRRTSGRLPKPWPWSSPPGIRS